MNKAIIFGLAFFALAGTAQAEGFMPWTDVMIMADTNHDGALDMQEVDNFSEATTFIGFQPFIREQFKIYDTNHDGRLSMAELKMGTMKDELTDPEVSVAFFKGLGFMPSNHN